MPEAGGAIFGSGFPGGKVAVKQSRQQPGSRDCPGPGQDGGLPGGGRGQGPQPGQGDGDAQRVARQQYAHGRGDLAPREAFGDDLGLLHGDQHAAGAADQPSGQGGGESIAGAEENVPQHHHRRAAHQDGFVAKPRPQHAAGQRDENPGKKIQSDQQAQLGVIEAQIGHHEPGNGRNGLELVSEADPQDHHQRQHGPAVGQFGRHWPISPPGGLGRIGRSGVGPCGKRQGNPQWTAKSRPPTSRPRRRPPSPAATPPRVATQQGRCSEP